MALSCLTRALRSPQAAAQFELGALVPNTAAQCRGFLTSASLEQNKTFWKQREKYTIRPIGMKKTGGRDHTGFEPGKEAQSFEEKVVEVRYDSCRSADIAMVAGGNRKRWIVATENMQVGDVIKTSGAIGRMAGTRSS
ncbi:large ribosomal subunit protein uL2m-like isoform X2 [Paralichthys olivaceus]|uniref:large ribosomal subunit protein uL2m-like isoform X2 n=1 Tax=Paralichthys olivaceus TaxID=8255 RepID=UPI003750809E